MFKQCVICKKQFNKSVKEGLQDWNKRKFCSQQCYHIYQKLHSNKGVFKKGNHPKSEFKKGHPKPKNAHSFPAGKNHPNWKGNNASYSAFHQRLHKIKGLPKKCEICGLNNKNRMYHWANLTGKFENIDDYKRMCVSCHRKFDFSRQIDKSNKY